MSDEPAFPFTELSRHVVQPGLTAHEYATIAFTAGLIVARPLFSPIETTALAREYADAALAHRASGSLR